MTQYDTIINILSDTRWHCASEFRKAEVPEYRSRINELRKRGYVFAVPRKCQSHLHTGGYREVMLISAPQDRMFTSSGYGNATEEDFIKQVFHNKLENKFIREQEQAKLL